MTHIKKAALAITVMLMAGCEAPLDLTAVEAMQAETTKRFDMYQDAAAVGDRVLITSSVGAGPSMKSISGFSDMYAPWFPNS